MPKIAYTVTCAIAFRSREEEWLDWMKNTHMGAVRAAGASAAQLVRLDPGPDVHTPITTYEIRYEFDNRGKFEEYLETHAPRLRRESLERFPVEEGFKYHRTAGEIVG